MKYAVNMTISPEIAQCNARMRPFEKKGLSGVAMYPVLNIDVAIKHVSVRYLSAPLGKRTAIDHASGSVLVSMPSDISGYHAHSILLGSRGLQMLSRVAYEADAKAEGVCVESPKCYAGYLYDLWACLQDHLAAEATIDARELLLKELRLKVVSQTGRNITRFENLMSPNVGNLSLYDADTGAHINTEADVVEAIAYRVKKASVNLINIDGLESRLFDIYRFCQGELADLYIDRHVERPMPKAVSYTYFTYAITDAALSFEIAEKGAVIFGDVTNKCLATAEQITAECSAADAGIEVGLAIDARDVVSAVLTNEIVIAQQAGLPPVDLSALTHPSIIPAAESNSSSLHSLSRPRLHASDANCGGINVFAEHALPCFSFSVIPSVASYIGNNLPPKENIWHEPQKPVQQIQATYGEQLELFDLGIAHKLGRKIAASGSTPRNAKHKKTRGGPKRVAAPVAMRHRAKSSENVAIIKTSPSPSAKIQTVHNLPYLQFESRKSGRVAPHQASLQLS